MQDNDKFSIAAPQLLRRKPDWNRAPGEGGQKRRRAQD
jgi:hypothetical protein